MQVTLSIFPQVSLIMRANATSNATTTTTTKTTTATTTAPAAAATTTTNNTTTLTLLCYWHFHALSNSIHTEYRKPPMQITDQNNKINT